MHLSFVNLTFDNFLQLAIGWLDLLVTGFEENSSAETSELIFNILPFYFLLLIRKLLGD